ncbi:MAG: KH domain-containing protein [Oscillospiraceae bacterium]|nr:KH domain-containing protein [Oscillospiraceae bacterium]
MKEQLQAIIEAIVSNPESVTVEEKQEGEIIVFEVKVAEADMGKVIGREGRIAKSIRTVMRAVAVKENKKISIEFVG